MKKILLIHHAKGINGSLVALLGIIGRLQNQFEIEVLCVFDSNAVDYIRATGAKVHVCEHFFYRRFYKICEHTDAKYVNLLYLINYIQSFISYILNLYYFAPIQLKKFNDIEMIYLNSAFLSDWSRGAKNKNKKVVLHVREPFSKGIAGIRKAFFHHIIQKYADRIIAISIDNAHRIGLPDKTDVIYDDVLDINPKDNKFVNLNKQYKYFLYLGGQSQIKGFEQLVLSLNFLSQDIRVLFAGYIPLDKKNRKIKRIIKYLLDPFNFKLERLYRILRNSPNVELIGTIDNVMNYLKCCHALISPFTKPHVSLPILEAYSIGKPVVVSELLGIDEFVDLSTGMIFANGQSKELAEKMNHLAQYTMEQIENVYDLACREKLQTLYFVSENINDIVLKTFNS